MNNNKELTIELCIKYLSENLSSVSDDQYFELRDICLTDFRVNTKTHMTQSRLKKILEYNPLTGVFLWLSCGSCAGMEYSGYLSISMLGSSYKAHRLAWLYMYGKFPDNQIDHINGIKDDNRILNLRDVTQAENCKNSKIAVNNTSGFKGVEWIPSRNKWRALISSNGKKINLGSHSCKIDAVAAVIRARKMYGFHSNHGRK